MRNTKLPLCLILCASHTTTYSLRLAEQLMISALLGYVQISKLSNKYLEIIASPLCTEKE